MDYTETLTVKLFVNRGLVFIKWIKRPSALLCESEASCLHDRYLFTSVLFLSKGKLRLTCPRCRSGWFNHRGFIRGLRGLVGAADCSKDRLLFGFRFRRDGEH